MEAYLIAIAIIALIYILLSLGLSLQYGLTGLINFGHVGFFAIGAYTSAILALNGVPLVLSFAGSIDFRYVTSLQIASDGSVPPQAGIPRGRP